MIFNKEFASDVYDALVKHAGATENEKDSFIYHHTNHDKYGETLEWRFCGNLGFGGKYWSNRNKVDCYSENLNKETKKIINETNKALEEVAKKHGFDQTFDWVRGII